MTQRSKAERRAALAAMQGKPGESFGYVDGLRHARHASTKTPADPKRFAKGGDIDAPDADWAAPRSNEAASTPLILTTWSAYHGGAHRTLSIDGKGPAPLPYRHDPNA